ncbi:hypothetical protein D9758_013475 [Tetrapyrgos nigripes]|uniref:Uncharacterized protein n=1 Tax=Tetrapyrgos nigripes TaxID=182062 RepID=A0A8H5CRL6_9AGAR|nr:hypothetical protein D9758_013475 [Tetrapyrgos nigripes]
MFKAPVEATIAKPATGGIGDQGPNRRRRKAQMETTVENLLDLLEHCNTTSEESKRATEVSGAKEARRLALETGGKDEVVDEDDELKCTVTTLVEENYKFTKEMRGLDEKIVSLKQSEWAGWEN